MYYLLVILFMRGTIMVAEIYYYSSLKKGLNQFQGEATIAK